MSSALYAQVPLRDPRSEIRLLTVFPGSFREPIVKCNLRSVPIANPGEYEGLSYHWTGATKDSVYINDIKTAVSGNLYNALLALRSNQTPRVLWVDAVCIDQTRDEENGEKSHQLHLMRQIYQEAQQTVAWFGLDTERDVSFLIRFRDDLLRAQRKVQLEEPWAVKVGKIAHVANEDERRKYGIPNDSNPGWKALAHLVTRSWTTRVWTIQEVAVARKTVIQCGMYSFRMEDIALAFSFMWTLGIKGVDTLPSHFRSTWSECMKQQTGQRRTLLSLVIRHWLSDATRPHDKIYALCGLASDAGSNGLDIRFDYTRKVDDVYTDFARAALRAYRNLDILSALAPFHADRSKDLPSWVPDWRVFNNGTLIYRRQEPPPEPGPCLVLFTSSKCTASDPIFSENGRSLRLDGHILDVITDIGALRPVNYTPKTIVDLLVDWRNKVARCANKKRYAPTGQSTIDVFYHTMTMGNLSNFLEDPLKAYQQFDRGLLILKSRWKRKSVKLKPGDVSWQDVLQSSVMSACRPCVNRRLIRTKSGYLGLVHGKARVGDQIGLFRGGCLPLIIRQQGRAWRMVGDGYVHGVMMGEMFEDQKCTPFWFS